MFILIECIECGVEEKTINTQEDITYFTCYECLKKRGFDGD